jgi:enterochelin esterase-like enzyme
VCSVQEFSSEACPIGSRTIYQFSINQTLKNGLKMIWFKTGSEDPFIGNTKATVEMLKRHGFSVTFEESTGGHNWVTWRNYLHEFAPKLFR